MNNLPLFRALPLVVVGHGGAAKKPMDCLNEPCESPRLSNDRRPIRWVGYRVLEEGSLLTTFSSPCS